MIDGLYSALNNYQTPQAAETGAPRKVLRMVKSERMGGSIPVWENVKSNADVIESSLTQALSTGDTQTPENALAYQATANDAQRSAQASQEFGFGDLIDMINPLHHVPVVGHIYRELTGDEIKPIGNIIGGALYGGALGAASGLINAVIQEETGRDLTGNAMALVLNSEAPSFGSKNAAPLDNPEARLAAATKTQTVPTHGDLPGNLLAFTDLKARPNIVIERVQAADGRTAGGFSKASYPKLDENPLPLREPITQVRFGNLNS